MSSKWIEEGGVFYPINGNIVLHSTPGPGVWQIYQSPSSADKRLGLSFVSSKFEFDYKIYETGGSAIIEKAKKCWESDLFVQSGKNLGIILNGTKGTGKTVASKLLCNSFDLPVIIVNGIFEGLILPFIQSLEFECIILLDEAEKTFSSEEESGVLLKMIDGVYNKARKLYVLTTNRLTVNENLLGRPGRIRYIQEFKNLPAQAVREYIDDNLVNTSQKSKILEEVDLLEISTIDILKVLVEEANIMGDIEGSGSLLNIPRARYSFDIAYFEGLTMDDVNKVNEVIRANKKDDESLYDWFTSYTKIEGDNISNTDILEKIIEGCGCCYTRKVTSSVYKFFKDDQFSDGVVLSEPTPEGFFMVKRMYYEDEEVLALILKQRSNPSLYRGGLVF